MNEQRVNEIMGMIEDKLDDTNSMAIRDEKAPLGFFTWIKMNLVREVLREAADDREQ